MLNPAPAKPAPRITLSSVTKGKTGLPPRIVLYGVPGVGKTTFALSAPSPVVIPAEPGIDKWPDVPQFPAPASYSDVLEALHSLDADGHPYKSVVIDTLDAIEHFVWDDVVKNDPPSEKTGYKAKNIEEVGGGFMKGYVVAVDHWRLMLAALERLHNRGMWVIVVDHCAVRNFKNPLGADFDKYTMKIHEKAAATFHAWADAQLFAQFEVSTEFKGRKVKGVSRGIRMLRCEQSAAYAAKNRLSLPDPLPVSWEDFEAAWQRGQVADPKVFVAAIAEVMTQLAVEGEEHEKFAAIVAAEVEKSADNSGRLSRILNRLNAKLAENGAAT